MTEVVLQHSPSHFPSSPSSYTPSPPNDEPTPQPQSLLSNHSNPISQNQERDIKGGGGDNKEGDQLSLLALLLTVFRKSLVACRALGEDKFCSMEIGVPTDVRHVAHVTFDRFHGFLGLPVEFEPEVPRRAPSASASVFGVSTESMQCSYDSRGNSVPTILLLMQRCLYIQGGLRSEGIFRINAENSQEEFVRDQLNRGDVPDGIDVHCLAGLIKAWFRELPSGVLDPLDPEQVMQCQTEDECAQLVRLLPPTEGALLDWAINLMADVVQEEHHNKMNARNVAMVFAPNMTQMADPLTALMYAVQVMNFLKTLIMRTLKGREDSLTEVAPDSHQEPSDENEHQSSSEHCGEGETREKEETEHVFITDEPVLENEEQVTEREEDDSTAKVEVQSSQTSTEKAPSQSVVLKNGPRKSNRKRVARVAEKSKGVSIVSSINSRTERVEAWRLLRSRVPPETPPGLGTHFHQIFETPAKQETPQSLIESLTSWNHIKTMKPSIDHLSSFTEIFGELHFKENPENSSSSSWCKSQKQWNPMTEKPKNSDGYSSKNQESLQLCTEALGSESFDDVEDLNNVDTGDNNWKPSDDDDDDEEHVHEREERRIVRHSSMGNINEELKRSKASNRSFPPPISCIGRSGKPWVSFKSYRHDGRFVLKEVKIPTQEFLHAFREDGRLRLHFVQPDEEETQEDDVDEDQDEDEEGEGEEGEEEEHDGIDQRDEKAEISNDG
ncbi:hypothetical protein GIB67_012782 [Kingdonia uniflora]|uniref:Rho GTPase activating protein n=1 Tax=Kingdonia uniflora TaxID=39325 RepID=A0A7J7NFC0_9MAGN|nr:hypothetical protein GIB67_012782 [Kingdonia uniflora]